MLAGPVQDDHRDYFADQVEPLLDGDHIRYVGTVGGEQRESLFARSKALLMPIEWPEPFGLVMVEALATGTPVIAFDRGSASEIVTDGETGFLVTNTEEMTSAIGRLGQIDPRVCRASVEANFALPRVLESYEAAYSTLADTGERALEPR